jgi:alpha-beta hydrolase superfamily lysophospholipase
MKSTNQVRETNSKELDSQKITYRYVEVNGIKLHVAIAGPASGEPVILLHGFPDASFGWENQILYLAQNNFYVIAPDQRGNKTVRSNLFKCI